MSSTKLSAVAAITIVGAVVTNQIRLNRIARKAQKAVEDFEETQRTVDTMMAKRAENAYCITTL